MKCGGTHCAKCPNQLQFILAPNQDLWKMVKKGPYRENLYYRM
ncbi:sigma 54-interacting transcriptional regulator [Neobacillus cucumis]